jgi:hypothetical protein
MSHGPTHDDDNFHETRNMELILQALNNHISLNRVRGSRGKLDSNKLSQMGNGKRR